MKTIALLFFLLLPGLIHGQEDTVYTSTLKEMFVLAGSGETFQMAITQIIGIYKQNSDDVPAEAWNELEKEFLKTSIDDLVVMLVPVYKKHLSLDDLKKIIEFYNTPAGKKFAEKTPYITRESMQVGEAWGRMVGEKVGKKLKEIGY